MKTFLCAYDLQTILSLVLVPTLSVALLVFIFILLFAKRRVSGMVAAQFQLNKAAALLDRLAEEEDNLKLVKKLASALGKAQFATESVLDRQDYDITPLIPHLTMANKIADAMFNAKNTDEKYREKLRAEIDYARTFLNDKCGIDKNVEDLHRTDKQHKKADAEKFLNSLDNDRR